jgi:hypothetical protein
MTLQQTLERFDELWDKADSWVGSLFGSYDEFSDDLVETRYSKEGIKQFITEEYTSMVEAEIARLEGLKRKIDYIPTSNGIECTNDRDFGYNGCLQDQINYWKNKLK